MRVLIVEDEAALRRQIGERLTAAGFKVQESGDGAEGLYFATEYPYDAAIIDLGLPGLSGLKIIAKLRGQGSLLPILVLTARDRWQDKVEGLEAGADDYLTKPFQMEELEARVRALVRRALASADQELRCGPLRLDLKSQQVWMDGRELELTAFEYQLLERLVTQRGRVLSKRELADHLYPHDQDRDSNVLEVLIGRLRRKLDPDGALNPIETLRGRGYRFTLGA
ncbi:response regulator with CheY-like receiver domain and winged-helix DNA-binding domain [Thioflavicoccus mobilis 8321]|uniref:Response regulator with CheY-like receiver domain and winged-helix DNA-binding domain n=1 Tax=Thioflavicoccus mobilis 8321 TaxID=765912 RepID=L0H1E5_9GAMM|nr:response regulator transcription factor [Thioflavicoccus mobilis]AGA91877.1 response regulator with CheY-like receiver domain and winged-helix DNA-binding domain [Thioflavicoccus mobilis 8321]